LEQLFRNEKDLDHLRFYRDKIKNVCEFDKKHPPVVVSYNEMLNFIKLTSVESEHIKLVEPEHCHYKSGDMVRIVDGDFAGVIGRVARIAGQQRVAVEISGLCIVATAYIPKNFICRIDGYY
jgi:transcription antitermination factor NusG